MNKAEKVIWDNLKKDITNEILATHIPVIEETDIIDYINIEMDSDLAYVGRQGYKRDRGFYFVKDDNRFDPELQYVSQNYEEVKQRYIKSAAQAIARLYVHWNRELLIKKWESNTWSMTGKFEANGIKNKEYDPRKYEYDIEIYLLRKLLPKDIVASEIKRKLSNLKYDKENTWVYSEDDYEFIIV